MSARVSARLARFWFFPDREPVALHPYPGEGAAWLWTFKGHTRAAANEGSFSPAYPGYVPTPERGGG